jgi:hypothetical protein
MTTKYIWNKKNHDPTLKAPTYIQVRMILETKRISLLSLAGEITKATCKKLNKVWSSQIKGCNKALKMTWSSSKAIVCHLSLQ